MAYQQAPSHPFQIPGAVAGMVVRLRLRANGTTPAGLEATAIVPAGPNTPFGTIVAWPQLNQSARYDDGSVAGNAGAGQSWAQGTPLLQNSGAGLRGSISASVNGAAGENRIGWKSTVFSGADTIQARALEYCFATNGYDWMALLNGAMKASGTMQPGQRLFVNIYDTRVDYLVADQLVYTEGGAAPQSVYYPAAFFGGAAGSRYNEVRVTGNLARAMTYADYTWGPGWTGGPTTAERTGMAGEWGNYWEYNLAELGASGLKLVMPQGRGIEYRIKVDGEIVYNGGSDTIRFEGRDLAGKTVRVEIKQDTYIYTTPEYSVLYF